MSWYMAIIVRGSFTEQGHDRERMGDLLYKLVEAPDAEAAYGKAVALGEAAVDTYNDEEGVEVTLRYLGLADLMEIAGPPDDGAEVYSQAINTKPGQRAVEKEALTVFGLGDPRQRGRPRRNHRGRRDRRARLRALPAADPRGLTPR